MKDWRQRRRERQTRELEARRRLREEYVEKLEARDRDVLDASLDYGDHDNMPWRAEVGLALGLLVLFIVVPLLVLLFSGLKALAGS